ncbi:hypothetical protein QQS21_009606 [Conoideocrella luteorostrata]|uniref:TPR-like protein n=1 Tax=Conoideocrella luteorostrata TaxID=1105319 RepID=A0AAJ0CGX6_9HYPO|nr:hypothetical protein QQS21_009606 [Conoideocrella luteorostrata]
MSTTTFGDFNSGFQAKMIHGPVNAEFHHYHPALERPETPPLPSILIPFVRDRDFVNRGEVLDRIKYSFSQPGSRTALVGLGGIGKSQLAIEYAYRTREQSPTKWVFWVHASNAARFEQSFRDIATCIRVPGRQNPKANIFQLVHDWLRDARQGPWVIVLDNVDDASFLKAPVPGNETGEMTAKTSNSKQLILCIPQCQHGSVLITSRSRGAALELVEYADIITIEPMDKKDALQLFRNKLGQSDDENCVAELARALEYMPLAIVQAAAYILQRKPRCSAQEYLNKFRHSDKRKIGLLGLEGGKLRRDTEAKNAILITWQMSFDYIRKTRTSAADLLSLMSFCDRQGIPETLLRDRNDCVHDHNEQNLRDGTHDVGEEDEHNNITVSGERTNSEGENDSDSDSIEFRSNYSDNNQFENDIIALRDFCFITANDDRTSFEMHRLVQLATLEWLRAHKVYEQWKNRFLVRLCAEIPEGEYKNWTKCQALFPHAQSVAAQRPVSEKSMKEWATILYRAAWYALRVGKGIEAEDLSIKALKARKKIFDKPHRHVTDSKAMVALAYSLRGRWEAAEELEVQVMETSKKKLGEDHPDTLTSMGNLASIYRNQGRWEAAEELDMQVMETHKKKLGEDHPNTLTSMGNLASTYRNQGRWEAAEELEVQVMETHKKKLGEDHPDTLTSMGNLASTYRNQGRWEAAEELEVQVMETRKKKLGEDHPDTLTSIGNLASTYRNQGRWEAAEELDVQVMETHKKKLGEDHPDTLTSMGNLASTYRNQGRWEAAEELDVQVMETHKKKLGEDHPSTLTSMGNLASTYWNQGRWEAAEELEVQVMETRKKKLGEDHPDTLTSMGNLASIYSNQGQWKAAEELEVQVMETRKKKLGEDHPDTLTSMNNLAWTYWESQRAEEAIKLIRRCVRLAEAKLGIDHPNYLSSSKTLASWEA